MTDCIQPIAEKPRVGFAFFDLDAEGPVGSEDGIWRVNLDACDYASSCDCRLGWSRF